MAPVLPDIEKTPILLARFTDKASSDLIRLVKERLSEEGLITGSLTTSQNHEKLMTITTTQAQLEREAERIHLVKAKQPFENKNSGDAGSRVMEYFTVSQRNLFRQPSTDAIPRDRHGLFTTSEWVLLVRRMADRVEVLPEHQSISPLSRLLDEFHVEYSIQLEADESIREVENSSRRNLLLREQGAHSVCLRYVLQTYGLVDHLSPIHLPVIRDEVLKDSLWGPWYRISPNVQAIKAYYGWEIAFYFGWMKVLTNALVYPAIMGIAVYLFRMYRRDTLDEDEFTPFYGLITFLWAILLLRLWEREENRLSYAWGTFSLSAYERQKYFAPRPAFRGYLRVSPVTGEAEVYYPAFRRRLKYLVSSIVTLGLLGLAFIVMIISLNAQGYIRPSSDPDRWNDSTSPHPFHVQAVAQLSLPGAICDSKSWWRSLIPVIVHSVCINVLNNVYRIVAEKLTEWENHETETAHRNSVVLKRFLFEAFDCYIALFYLAFYERNVDKLRLELVAIFQIDTLRRVFLESVVPLAMHRLSKKSNAHGRNDIRFQSHSASSPTSIPIPTDNEVLETLELEVYESFDDMMEIVIQVGYVCLFASAYPLASSLSILANWIEIRSDAFKLAYVCQRSFTFRQSSLGMWKTLLSCVIWSSALTNCLIAGFTSHQLVYYFDGGDNAASKSSYTPTFVIFGLEHVLIVLGLLIYAVVPAVPERIQEELERRQYLRMKESRETTSTSTPNKKIN